MTDERWHQVKAIFSEALDLPRSERAAFLANACGDNQELLSEVHSLLNAHEKSGAFLDRVDTRFKAAALGKSNRNGGIDDASGNTTTLRSRIGERIGPYRLVELIGTGGMGEVYRANRVDAEFDKQVAIKLVPGGYQANFILAGLRAERQILANLDHPNIARLIDGGATDDGSPYLVMELVEGQRLDLYCEQHKLTLQERLKLFCDVCAAVSYAHQHLVVHRDLKPSNIMVTTSGAVKLLDFGIAKLLQTSDAVDNVSSDVSGDTQGVAPTQTFMRALTPGFSSPEQILGRPITTASDVYSLGVVLYQLLTGRSPYRTSLNSTQDAIREICETEPVRPSELVDESNAPLSRDLDAITLRALRKEPEKRYSSVEQFAEDIRCFLRGLPVMARGDQFSYRLGKYLRRHKLPIAAAALFVFALFGGMIVLLRQVHIAELERARAERHFDSVRTLANTFVFQIHDDIRDLPNSTDARRSLVTTALKYLNTLAKEAGDNQSLTRELAFAYSKVGDIQGRVNSSNVGDPHAAFDSYSRAIALFEPLAAATPDDTDLRSALAQAYSRRSELRLSFGETQQAADDLQHALTVLESLVAEHPTIDSRFTLAETYSTSVEVLWMNNDPERALINTAKAIAIMEKLTAESPADRDLQYALSSAYGNRAMALTGHDKNPAAVDEALGLIVKASEIGDQLVAATNGANARFLRLSFANHVSLCNSLYDRGDYVEAVKSCIAARPMLDKLSTDTQNAQILMDAARFRWTLGDAQLAAGDLTGATTTYGDNVTSLERILKTTDSMDAQYILAISQHSLGKIESRLAALSIKNPAVQLKHWSAAKQWLELAIRRFQNVEAKRGETTRSKEEGSPLDEAVAELVIANAALAQKKTN